MNNLAYEYAERKLKLQCEVGTYTRAAVAQLMEDAFNAGWDAHFDWTQKELKELVGL